MKESTHDSLLSGDYWYETGYQEGLEGLSLLPPTSRFVSQEKIEAFHQGHRDGCADRESE